MNVGIYVRTSGLDQHPQNQLIELRRYAQARAWAVIQEYTDQISGTTDRRPGLDAMLADARRHRFDLVLCSKLDRLGRSVRHLVLLLEELRVLNVGFTTVGEGLDTTTPAGRMVTHFLAAIAEFERERLRERTHLGLARARAEGKRLGRPRKIHPKSAVLDLISEMSHREAAERLGVSMSTVKRLRRAVRQAPGPKPGPKPEPISVLV